mgnify:CR=1 FL=1
MKHTFSKKVLLLSGGLFVLGAFQPDAAHAASFNLCKAADIPGSTLQRIRQRDDFADLLSQVVQVCPAQALILTDGPTASISGASADDGNGFSEGGETASPADDVDDEPDGGGAPGGGGNDAPDDEDDGGKDDDGGEDTGGDDDGGDDGGDGEGGDEGGDGGDEGGDDGKGGDEGGDGEGGGAAEEAKEAK